MTIVGFTDSLGDSFPLTICWRLLVTCDRARLMKHCWGFFLIALLIVQGCDRRSETPPEVAQAYSTLRGSLDLNSPGASFTRLQDFARQNSQYAIASTVDVELGIWRTRLDEAYLAARDLVREQEFDRAEAILTDLAQVPEEQAGQLSREFLAFEFAQMKATQLLQQGDTAAADAVLRELTERDLGAAQMVAAQRLLDSTTVMGRGMAMTRTTAMMSAARTLQVLLFESYIETGRYPAALTLDSPELASLGKGQPLADVVASIDDYRATEDAFSLILTGQDPSQRIRVTDRTVEAVR